MSIKTEITQDDYTAFVKYVARRVSVSSGDRTVVILVGLAIGLGIGLSLSLLRLSLHFTTLSAMAVAGFAGAFFVAALIATISRRQIQRMRPSDDGFVIGAQQVSLGEDGIRQESRHHHSLFDWSLVGPVETTQHHIFVMVDQIAGIILPKRAFSSDAEIEQFVSEIARRLAKIAT